MSNAPVPPNTCGHTAPRVTLPPRCRQCGKYAHRENESFRVAPALPWLLEWLTRRYVRRMEVPVLEGQIVRSKS